MLAQHKTNTNIGVGLGILLQAGGNGVGGGAGLLIMLVGAVAFIWGCSEYARAKGHSAAWGFLGLLSIFGLLGLMFLPDNHKDGV